MPDARQIAVKIPLAAAIDQAALIPVFHRWIQEKRIADQLLIDVVDYRHVHEGPGVMLIANEGHYGLDSGRGSTGLRYAARRDPAGPVADKLRETLRRTLEAAAALESEPALDIGFDTSAIEIEVGDRLCDITGDQLGEAARAVLGPALGAVAIAVRDDPRLAPQIAVTAGEPRPVAELLAKL